MAIQDEIPKSRITLTYKTEVDGTPTVVNLPLRLLLIGDYSGGTSKDRKLDLEDRKIRILDGKNTSEVMKDMGISLNIVVPNRINPTSTDSIPVELSINNMNSFSPQEVAKQIPQIRSLMLLKQLLSELTAAVANKKELDSLLNKLYADKDAFEKVKESLKGFSAYQLPDKSEAPAEVSNELVETKVEE